jgi:hypothetical protein
MTTANEYWELAADHSNLADAAPPDSHSRRQLQSLEDNYMSLAESMEVSSARPIPEHIL